jgi:transposase
MVIDLVKELHLAREALVKDRTAAKDRRKVLTASLPKRQNTQRLEQIDRPMAAIEAAILEQIRGDPDLAQRFAILTSIPGVSAVTAFALLIEMPELGALEAGQAASLAGLAPVARQSAAGTDAPSSEEAEPQSAKPSICQPSSRPASIRT